MIRLLHKLKLVGQNGSIEELVIWAVPISAKQPQGIRYRLAYVPAGQQRPAVLYDNHYPKGHHKHIGDLQIAYDFVDIKRLMEDFKRDIEAIK